MRKENKATRAGKKHENRKSSTKTVKSKTESMHGGSKGKMCWLEATVLSPDVGAGVHCPSTTLLLAVVVWSRPVVVSHHVLPHRRRSFCKDGTVVCPSCSGKSSCLEGGEASGRGDQGNVSVFHSGEELNPVGGVLGRYAMQGGLHVLNGPLG